jgi:hypothetical protein
VPHAKHGRGVTSPWTSPRSTGAAELRAPADQ